MFTIIRKCTAECSASHDVRTAYVSFASVLVNGGRELLNSQERALNRLVMQDAASSGNPMEKYLAGVAMAWRTFDVDATRGLDLLRTIACGDLANPTEYAEQLIANGFDTNRRRNVILVRDLALIALLVHSIEVARGSEIHIPRAIGLLSDLVGAGVIPAAAAYATILPRSKCLSPDQVRCLRIAISDGDPRAMYHYAKNHMGVDCPPPTIHDIRMMIFAYRRSISSGDIPLPIYGSGLGEIPLMIGLHLLSTEQASAISWLRFARMPLPAKDISFLTRMELTDMIMEGGEPIHHSLHLSLEDLERIDARARVVAGRTDPRLVGYLRLLTDYHIATGRVCPVDLICLRYGIGQKASPNIARDIAHDTHDDPLFRWCFAKWSRDDDNPFIGLSRVITNRHPFSSLRPIKACVPDASPNERTEEGDVAAWSAQVFDRSVNGIVSFGGPYAGMTPEAFEDLRRVKAHGTNACATIHACMSCPVCFQRYQMEHVAPDGFMTFVRGAAPDATTLSLAVAGPIVWSPSSFFWQPSESAWVVPPPSPGEAAHAMPAWMHAPPSAVDWNAPVEPPAASPPSPSRQVIRIELSIGQPRANNEGEEEDDGDASASESDSESHEGVEESPVAEEPAPME